METIRVLITDDQAITRSRLKALLTSLEHLEVIAEASDGEEVVKLADDLEPDVILMDLRMPVLNGIEATRRIHTAQPHIGILVVTVFEDDTSVFPAIRAGARGYLLKNTDQGELHRAIQTVANGGAIFSPGIAQRVMQYLTTPTPPGT
jgi:DNA-binding NarL/FixJ family response regulator